MTNLPMRRTVLCLLPLLMLGLVSAVACSSTEQEGSPGPEASASNHLEQAALGDASPSAFDGKYAELRAQGKSHKAATELARIYAAEATDNATPGGTHHTLEAAVMLAKFSATDPQEAKQREQAAEELTMRFESGDLDVGRAVNLLSTITPDASTEDRTQVAGNLARLSSADDLDDRDHDGSGGPTDRSDCGQCHRCEQTHQCRQRTGKAQSRTVNWTMTGRWS